MNTVKKKYKYLYSRMLDEAVIRKAYKNARRKKTDRPEIKKIDRNLDFYVEKMRRMLKNTKPEGVPVEHPELAFSPKRHEPSVIVERGKRRKIYKPAFTEQWVHHILMIVLEPIFIKQFYVHSNASVPGRGVHRGKKTLLKWIRQGFKYFVKCDIRHYYDSIEKEKLMSHLESFIEDEWFMHMVKLCLSVFRKGIPIGYYISQWFGNSFLTGLDILLSGRKVKYMRYADDILVCGNNKKELHSIITEIRRYIGKLHLKLKGNWQVCRFDYIRKNGKRTGRAIDFMGFKFYRNRTALRKNILKNSRRIAKRIRKSVLAGKKIFHKHASALLSYMGWITHTDTYGWYLRNIKQYVEIRKLKRLLSKIAKKEGKKEHDRMEKRDMRKSNAKRAAKGFA